MSHRISVSCRQEFARLTPTPTYKKVAKSRAPSTIHSPDRITYRRAQRPALIQAGSEAHQVPICLYYSMHSYFSIYQIYWKICCHYSGWVIKWVIMGVVKESGEFSRLKQGRGYPDQKNSERPKNGSAPDLPFYLCTTVAPCISMKATVCWTSLFVDPPSMLLLSFIWYQLTHSIWQAKIFKFHLCIMAGHSVDFRVRAVKYDASPLNTIQWRTANLPDAVCWLT